MIIGDFREFIRALDSLDWSDLPVTFPSVVALFEHLNSNREVVRAEINKMTQGDLTRLVEVSHERTTHFKWLVHKNPDSGYSIWLHDYKTETMRRPGFAEVPHNHVYWFCSLVLLGGFRHHKYVVNMVTAGEVDRLEGIEEIGSEYVPKGTVYTVGPTVVHSLSEIEAPTLTLFLRSRAVRPYSETFESWAGTVTRYYPYASRLLDLAGC